ncbi:MAG TPA: MFS transporter, partial [Chitinophagaceae bacterium]|nr:MFS transporter [Chitinophagaceae bacterium]
NPEELNTISAYINATFILGGAVGGFIAGIVCDKAGRKKSLILAMGCLGLFTLLTGYMQYWQAIVACRFLTGCGLGAVLVATTTIMMEEWPEKTRAIFMGFLSIAMPVGIFSAGLIDYLVSSWRQAFVIGACPLILALCSVWLLKESGKWTDNRANANKEATAGDSIFSSVYRLDLFTGALIFGTMLIGLWAIFSWLPTWIQQLVSTGDAQKPRGISMMMMGAGGLLGGFLSGWLINAFGARKLMLLCFAVCASMSFVLFKINSVLSPVVYAEILVLALFFGVSQGALSVYIPHLFPVHVRGMATGFCFNIGRIFTATAVLFVGVLVTELGGYSNALFVFSLVFVLGAVVTFFSKDPIGEEPVEISELTIQDLLKENVKNE